MGKDSNTKIIALLVLVNQEGGDFGTLSKKLNEKSESNDNGDTEIDLKALDRELPNKFKKRKM